MKRRGINFKLAISALFIFSAVTVSAQSDTYLIQPRDTVEIKIWRYPDLDTEVEVDQDGNINLPLLGKVPVAKLTPRQLEENLTRLWGRDYIKKPYVRVYIQKKKFFVLGEVKSPGAYKLEGRITILKAISMAGGFTDYAAKGGIYILRGSNSESKKIDINISRIEKGKTEDIGIEPGDIVTIPQSIF